MNIKIFTKNEILMSVLFLLLLPLALAYNGWGYYWYSPSQLFQNEWMSFALIFIVFFAMSFFALGRTIDNKGANAVISIALALFISYAIVQRTRFYGFIGEQIGSWLILLALLLALVLFIKLVTGIIGGIGLFIALGVGWFVLHSFDPYDIFPYQFLTSDFFPYYEFLSGTGFLFLLIIILAFIIAISFKNDKVRKWLWKAKEKKKITIEQ